ncbi:unnamed protein product [Chrysoparadoxa australica]
MSSCWTLFGYPNDVWETSLFILFAVTAALAFAPAMWFVRVMEDFIAAVLVPPLCVILCYEYFILALGDTISTDNPAVQVAKTTHALVVPLFLASLFEMAYDVHKKRSVKFFCIVFDQGHRIDTEPCSWLARNFVRLLSLALTVLGILVYYGVIGCDVQSGTTGFIGVDSASSLQVVLALVPTTVMAVVALFISVYMWKYGNEASIVVNATWFNRWGMLCFGVLTMLASAMVPECCHRIFKAASRLLLLISMMVTFTAIKDEFAAVDHFNKWLETNQDETGRGDSSSETPMPVSLP